MPSDITRNENMTIGTTMEQVARKVSEGKRVAISLRNSSIGGQVISITFGDFEQASANTGFVLAAGQSITDATSEGYSAWQGNVTAISDAAGAVLSIFERRVV